MFVPEERKARIFSRAVHSGGVGGGGGSLPARKTEFFSNIVFEFAELYWSEITRNSTNRLKKIFPQYEFQCVLFSLKVLKRQLSV